MIVQIALRLQYPMPGSHHVGDGFLGGRLARRTGHTNQRLAPKSPDGCAQALQGYQRVVHCEQACLRRKSRQLTTFHHRGDRATSQHGFHIVVPIKPLAAYRTEEMARSHECFFGEDRSYHVARGFFVHKTGAPCTVQIPAAGAEEKRLTAKQRAVTKVRKVPPSGAAALSHNAKSSGSR